MKSITTFLAICVLLFTTNAFGQFQFIAPQPGSLYHNPDRTIILREGNAIRESSLRKTDLFQIEGSASGFHDFKTILSVDGKTIILKPTLPFAFGETVTVTIHKGIERTDGKVIDGTSFYFEIHREWNSRELARLEDQRCHNPEERMSCDMGINADLMNPERVTPHFTITTNISPADGDIFFANASELGAKTGQYLIIKSNGDSVFTKESNSAGTDFKINHNGYLTLFNYKTDDYGGYDELDSSYYRIASFFAQGYGTDYHEFQIFPDGHYFVLGYDYQNLDLSVYDSSWCKNALVRGGILQEMDKNNNLIFEWRSWDHLEIPEALHENFTFIYVDPVHANSIEQDTDGNILLSLRALDQVDKIDINTGEFIWRLGGVKNQFTFINEPAPFNYQHDARRLPNGNITLFDNGNWHSPPVSSAKEYKLDETNKTATLVWSYQHPPVNGNLLASVFMGGVQRLSNGGTLINWGGIPYGMNFPSMTEIDSTGNIVWEMQMDDRYDEVIYRAHRYEWNPCARPSVKLLKTTDITSTSAKLNWLFATGAEKYKIQFRVAGDSTWSTTNAKGSLNYKILKNLLPSTKYEWQVASVCDLSGKIKSNFTHIKKFTTAAAQKNSLIAEAVNSEFEAYPNPARNDLFIHFSLGSEAVVQIRMLNIIGKEVYQSQQNYLQGDQMIRISLQNITPGIYFIEQTIDGEKYIRKIEVD